MEKSIETIWREGFLKEDALIVPKLNDLYNQKSQQLIEKLIRMHGKRPISAKTWIILKMQLEELPQ